MATITPFQRLTDTDQRNQALALLLTGKPRATPEAIAPFLDYARQQSLNIDEIWGHFQGRELIASTLIVPGRGRTAMLFVSPITTRRDTAPTTDLICHVMAQQNPDELRLIQTLLEPTQRLETRALLDANFSNLATLVYMQRAADKPARALRLFDHDDTPLQIYAWHESNRQRFADAILASYEDTLDCPGLLGLRQIDDIIAGHMGAGEFKPDLWHAIYRDDQPVGVLLVNLLPSQHAVELVYLGLTPAFRGIGLAPKLVEHALGIAREHHMSQLILAVDEKNTPALRLYRRSRLIPQARKVALIQTLGE